MAAQACKSCIDLQEFPYRCSDCNEEKFSGSLMFRLHCMYDGRTRVTYQTGSYNEKGGVSYPNGFAVLESAVYKLGDRVSPETLVAFRPVCGNCLNDGDPVPVTVKTHKENEAVIAAETAKRKRRTG